MTHPVHALTEIGFTARARSRPAASTRRRWTMTALVALCTGWVLLGPRSAIVDGRRLVSDWLTFHPWQQHLVELVGGVEAAGNLIVLAPIAAVTASAVRLRWSVLLVFFAFVLPFVVEQLQRYIPGRVTDPMDVIRNTVGAIVVVLIVLVVRAVAHLLRRLDVLLADDPHLDSVASRTRNG